MVIHYFERLAEGELRGYIIIDRVFGVGLEEGAWSASKKPLLPMFLAERGKGFEDAPGLAHADFANKVIGGGVLANGSIQEEIRFSICPELLASMLFCPCMDDDEAIQITGAEQFSAYKGYGHRLLYDGDYRDSSYPRDADGTPLISILAMDALDLRRKDASIKSQMSLDNVLRELNKALAAFTPVDEASLTNFPSIATGNWGCGAFKGDACLKALIQWAAASQCGRQLRYFPFELGWGPVLQQVTQELSTQGVTVGELVTALWLTRDKLREFGRSGLTLFEAVKSVIAVDATKGPAIDLTQGPSNDARNLASS
jgi:poly(ADP-ribose) glycohydrolase